MKTKVMPKQWISYTADRQGQRRRYEDWASNVEANIYGWLFYAGFAAVAVWAFLRAI